MAVPTIIQQDTAVCSGTKSVSINFTAADPDNNAITAGSTIVAVRAGNANDNRDPNASDDVDGPYTLATETGTLTRGAGIFYMLNATGGDTVVTYATTFNASYYICVYETDADTFDAADSNVVTSNSTTHQASASGINTAADCIVFLAVGTNANTSFDLTAGGFTEDYELTNVMSMGHKTSASAITGETGYYETGSSRFTYASVASFSVAGAGGAINIILTPDSLAITESTLTVQQDVDINVTLTPDSLVITESTLTVQQDVDINITLTPDSLVITETAVTVQQDVDINITLTPDSLVITESTFTITLGNNIEITLNPDSLVITESTLTIQQDVDVNITLNSDSLVITESSLIVQQDVDINITITPDSLVITETGVTVSIGNNINISLTPDSLVITESTLTVTQDVLLTLVPDSLIITESTLNVLLTGEIVYGLKASIESLQYKSTVTMLDYNLTLNL